MTMHHLHYDQAAETGVLFHMIGALSRYGQLGVTAISFQEVDAIYARAIGILDSEARRESGPRAARAGSRGGRFRPTIAAGPL